MVERFVVFDEPMITGVDATERLDGFGEPMAPEENSFGVLLLTGLAGGGAAAAAAAAATTLRCIGFGMMGGGSVDI